MVRACLKTWTNGSNPRCRSNDREIGRLVLQVENLRLRVVRANYLSVYLPVKWMALVRPTSWRLRALILLDYDVSMCGEYFCAFFDHHGVYLVLEDFANPLVSLLWSLRREYESSLCIIPVSFSILPQGSIVAFVVISPKLLVGDFYSRI